METVGLKVDTSIKDEIVIRNKNENEIRFDWRENDLSIVCEYYFGDFLLKQKELMLFLKEIQKIADEKQKPLFFSVENFEHYTTGTMKKFIKKHVYAVLSEEEVDWMELAQEIGIQKKTMIYHKDKRKDVEVFFSYINLFEKSSLGLVEKELLFEIEANGDAVWEVECLSFNGIIQMSKENNRYCLVFTETDKHESIELTKPEDIQTELQKWIERQKKKEKIKSVFYQKSEKIKSVFYQKSEKLDQFLYFFTRKVEIYDSNVFNELRKYHTWFEIEEIAERYLRTDTHIGVRLGSENELAVVFGEHLLLLLEGKEVASFENTPEGKILLLEKFMAYKRFEVEKRMHKL